MGKNAYEEVIQEAKKHLDQTSDNNFAKQRLILHNIINEKGLDRKGLSMSQQFFVAEEIYIENPDKYEINGCFNMKNIYKQKKTSAFNKNHSSKEKSTSVR